MVDANSELYAPVLGSLNVPLSHPLVERDSTPHRIDNAGELSEQPISRRLNHSPPVLGDARLDQFAEMGCERRQRSLLVLAHQPRPATSAARIAARRRWTAMG